jgi:uncharacterized membrane protein
MSAPRNSVVKPVSSSRARVTVSISLLVADLVVLIMTIESLHGPLRLVLGLVLGLVVPGWSVVGLLGLENAALEVGLTVAVSLASCMVVAQVLLTVHAWHLGVFQEVTCVLCLPSLIWQAHLRPRRLERPA